MVDLSPLTGMTELKIRIVLTPDQSGDAPSSDELLVKYVIGADRLDQSSTVTAQIETYDASGYLRYMTRVGYGSN